MIGTLTSAAGSSFQFWQNRRPFHADTERFVRNMSFTDRNFCRASVQTPPPPVGSSRTSASLYEVLRVKKNASSMEIKTAYRSLAKLYHPDSSRSDSSDGGDFIKIHKAYSTLSDPAMRAIYDRKLAIGSGSRPVRFAAAGDETGFYRTRRWETDQCW